MRGCVLSRSGSLDGPVTSIVDISFVSCQHGRTLSSGCDRPRERHDAALVIAQSSVGLQARAAWASRQPGALDLQQVEELGPVQAGNGFEQVGMAQQTRGFGVAGTGVGQALEAAGFGVVLSCGQGLVGACGQGRVGQEAGGPADDGFVDPGPPCGVVGMRIVSGAPVQPVGSAGGQQVATAPARPSGWPPRSPTRA
ncbi:hypothetical protein AQI88_15840 [Streptomyces cellostaticus]|uniref:Uncharacterized protein n=2 Tax=Streptomyces cellostaticus TaxID=67285 RepID=A0A117PWA7_9ACTN|nr:hypothetical protein AQI88_15840 [Streptomyces cellostaticus]GHI09874.1 hypothetical protein Scel_81950 [Streptomyces cellostaticus]